MGGGGANHGHMISVGDANLVAPPAMLKWTSKHPPPVRWASQVGIELSSFNDADAAGARVGCVGTAVAAVAGACVAVVGAPPSTMAVSWPGVDRVVANARSVGLT